MGSLASERYRYGLFLNPQPGDPCITDLAEAERLAKKMSIDNGGTPVAIWDSDDTTLRLYAGYEEFLPAK